MTYLQFLAVFILPPIAILYVAQPKPLGGLTPGVGVRFLGVISVIAFLYTTLWDNYLVANMIWTYGDDRVLGTIGYVPVEEYLFFILQPILTGMWYLKLRPSFSFSGIYNGKFYYLKTFGIVLALIFGVVCFRYSSTTYLALILTWALPIILLQWIWMGKLFTSRLTLITLAIWPPTLYLWIVDAIAIRSGIWTISDPTRTGIDLPGGLPIEEAVFFFVTNCLVVLGLEMFLSKYNPERVQG